MFNALEPRRACALPSTLGQGRRSFILSIQHTGRGKEFHVPYADDWGLSPDGSQIAFVDENEKESQIRLFSLATNEWHDVQVKGWSGFKSLDWSPTGKTMFVAGFKS